MASQGKDLRKVGGNPIGFSGIRLRGLAVRLSDASFHSAKLPARDTE